MDFAGPVLRGRTQANWENIAVLHLPLPLWTPPRTRDLCGRVRACNGPASQPRRGEDSFELGLESIGLELVELSRE